MKCPKCSHLLTVDEMCKIHDSKEFGKFKIKADNNSQDCDFWLSWQDGEFFTTLTGTIDNKPIQIDFNELNRDQIFKLMQMFYSALKHHDSKQSN